MQNGELMIYRMGLCKCSVCVPGNWTRERIVREVNLNSPTGISSKWEISKENFSGGEPNPCECNDDNQRKHYLMEC